MIEDFKVDGVSLKTLAFNIETRSGWDGLPPKRGDNQEVPYRPGQVWQPKEWDQRVLPLKMWVIGCNEDGTLPTVESRRARYNSNLQKLRKLFATRHRELALERTLDLPGGAVVTTGLGEVMSTMDSTTVAGATRGTFTVDMQMADPLWYGAQVTESVTSAGLTIVNVGEDIAAKMTISLIGPLVYPRLKNTTNGIDVRFNGTISGGQTVVLDTDAFTALNGVTNVIGNIRHAGSPWWMKLMPGNNAMTLDNWQGGAVGAGSVSVVYKPTYL